VSFGHVSLELPDGDVLGVVGVHSSEHGSPLSVNRGTVSGISSHTEDGSDEKENSKQRKRVTSNNDERTTNERTTNYIDDDNSPPGFFQNPRANNDENVCS